MLTLFVQLWVADHDLDDPDTNDANNTMPMLSVYMARGMLVESKKPTWLYGTSSEHAIFYQYAFNNAKNVHAGMIQTESPYFQPNPKPPSPFIKTKRYPGDQDFDICKRVDPNKGGTPAGCDASWAVRVLGSSDILISGAGLYSWFNEFDESCVDPRTCQKSLVDMSNNGPGIEFLNLVTIGAKTMITTTSGDISAESNAATNNHPRWSHIGYYQAQADYKAPEIPKPNQGPALAISPVSDEDMNAMLNGGGDKKGVAIALRAVPYIPSTDPFSVT